MSEAGRVGGRDGAQGAAGYVGSLVARAIERSRGKGMRLVISSHHGRRCISIRVIAAGTFFFFRWCMCVCGSVAAGVIFSRVVAAGVFPISVPQVFGLFVPS